MNKELELVINIAKQAGAILAKHFKQDLEIEYKQDEYDPVTLADKESDEYIRKALHELFPDDEILSEENDARPTSYDKRVWMVDPLDGTKDFVAGRGAFSVMIGLLDNKVPVLGVVYNPITNELIYATKDGGAFKVINENKVELKVKPINKLDEAILVTRNQVTGDKRPLDNDVDGLKVKSRIPEGSIGLKIGRIADGSADLFVHTNTHGCKWDTLAPQVILTEAGGLIKDLEGNVLDYTKNMVGWDKYFIAASNNVLLNEILKLVSLPGK